MAALEQILCWSDRDCPFLFVFDIRNVAACQGETSS